VELSADQRVIRICRWLGNQHMRFPFHEVKGTDIRHELGAGVNGCLKLILKLSRDSAEASSSSASFCIPGGASIPQEGSAMPPDHSRAIHLVIIVHLHRSQF
jgi:hypothetical protein